MEDLVHGPLECLYSIPESKSIFLNSSKPNGVVVAILVGRGNWDLVVCTH